MREWIYNDAGWSTPDGRRAVVRIQFEGEEEVSNLHVRGVILAALDCYIDLGLGETIHTPGEIPKWWKEEHEEAESQSREGDARVQGGDSAQRLKGWAQGQKP